MLLLGYIKWLLGNGQDDLETIGIGRWHVLRSWSREAWGQSAWSWQRDITVEDNRGDAGSLHWPPVWACRNISSCVGRSRVDRRLRWCTACYRRQSRVGPFMKQGPHIHIEWGWKANQPRLRTLVHYCETDREFSMLQTATLEVLSKYLDCLFQNSLRGKTIKVWCLLLIVNAQLQWWGPALNAIDTL